MITLGHHPVVQRIIDEWRQSLRSSGRRHVSKCTEEDLRKLIAVLEDTLDEMAERLDKINRGSFKAILLMKWNWIRQRTVAIRKHIRRRGDRR
jgi:hypothetical protein